MVNYNTIQTGTLTYNDDGEFELHSNQIFNLSHILHKIYYDRISNQITIKILDGCKTLFNEDGILYRKVLCKPTKTQHIIFDYYILGANLTECLLDNTGKNLEIIISSEAHVV